ncbi:MULTISPECIES: hypothetical protein [unclassified Wolbachia]|nr:hypothetical protein [Wolbachia endosymbiont (group A) of Apoderus coryli]
MHCYAKNIANVFLYYLLHPILSYVIPVPSTSSSQCVTLGSIFN